MLFTWPGRGKTWRVWKRCEAGGVYPNLQRSDKLARHLHFRMLTREQKDLFETKK